MDSAPKFGKRLVGVRLDKTQDMKILLDYRPCSDSSTCSGWMQPAKGQVSKKATGQISITVSHFSKPIIQSHRSYDVQDRFGSWRVKIPDKLWSVAWTKSHGL